MANELSLTASLSFGKGDYAVALSTGRQMFTVAGAKYHRGVQEIGLTQEALSIGDIGTPGYMLIVNRDRTNFVTIRPGSGAADLVKLKPGEFALFRLAMSGPYAIADTAPVNVEYVVIEN